MTLHYELTDETLECAGRTLHRIRATRDLPWHGVRMGDLGGWIESTDNLGGTARVYGTAWVYDNARVYGNARVFGNARVYDNAWVGGTARVFGNARVHGNARVYGNARVFGNARVYDNAWVGGTAQVFGNARVYGNARVFGDAEVKGAQHVLVHGPIGSEDVTITLHRTVTGHALHVGCWEGTVETLMSEVDRRAVEWGGSESDRVRWRGEYEDLIPMLTRRAAMFHKEVAA